MCFLHLYHRKYTSRIGNVKSRSAHSAHFCPIARILVMHLKLQCQRQVGCLSAYLAKGIRSVLSTDWISCANTDSCPCLGMVSAGQQVKDGPDGAPGWVCCVAPAQSEQLMLCSWFVVGEGEGIDRTAAPPWQADKFAVLRWHFSLASYSCSLPPFSLQL